MGKSDWQSRIAGTNKAPLVSKLRHAEHEYPSSTRSPRHAPSCARAPLFGQRLLTCTLPMTEAVGATKAAGYDTGSAPLWATCCVDGNTGKWQGIKVDQKERIQIEVELKKEYDKSSRLARTTIASNLTSHLLLSVSKVIQIENTLGHFARVSPLPL